MNKEPQILGLEVPKSTKITHRKPRKMAKPGRFDGLREYSHLSGGIARRKEQLKKLRKPHQPSGSKHYMVRRVRTRILRKSNDRYAYRWWRKDYKISHLVYPNVTYEDWWYVMRGTIYDTGKSKRVYLMPYTEDDHTIDNMYVSYQEWGLGHGRRVFLADARKILSERSERGT